MLTLEEMLIRLGVAILLGAIIGWEREMAGKEAGIRTDIVVSAGAALFAIASIALPYLTTLSPDQAMQAIIQNSAGLRVVSNVVVGIGFLGAGIIIHQGSQVRGLTTAASVWFVAAVGVLTGIGMTQFAIISATSITLLLLILRKIDLYGIVEKEREAENKKVGSRK